MGEEEELYGDDENNSDDDDDDDNDNDDDDDDDDDDGGGGGGGTIKRQRNKRKKKKKKKKKTHTHHNVWFQLGVLDHKAFDGFRSRRALRRILVHIGRNFVHQGLPRGTQILGQRVSQGNFSLQQLHFDFAVAVEVGKGDGARDQFD